MTEESGRGCEIRWQLRGSELAEVLRSRVRDVSQAELLIKGLEGEVVPMRKMLLNHHHDRSSQQGERHLTLDQTQG